MNLPDFHLSMFSFFAISAWKKAIPGRQAGRRRRRAMVGDSSERRQAAGGGRQRAMVDGSGRHRAANGEFRVVM